MSTGSPAGRSARRGLETGSRRTYTGTKLETADTAKGSLRGTAPVLDPTTLLLAGLVSASVEERVALGARAGRRARCLGEEPDAEGVMSRGPRQAHLDGFDLHANVWVGANDRAGLERLCRYVLRPPFAQARLRVRADGRVALELKQAWHDGTRELVFDIAKSKEPTTEDFTL